MDEISLTKAVSEGKRASLLVQDEMLQRAFAQLEHDYTEAWRNSAVLDMAAREKLWQAVQIVGIVRKHLAKVAADGRLSQKQLDDLAERRRRFKIV